MLDDCFLFWASSYHILLADQISMVKHAANTEKQNMH